MKMWNPWTGIQSGKQPHKHRADDVKLKPVMGLHGSGMGIQLRALARNCPEEMHSDSGSPVQPLHVLRNNDIPVRL